MSEPPILDYSNPKHGVKRRLTDRQRSAVLAVFCIVFGWVVMVLLLAILVMIV